MFLPVASSFSTHLIQSGKWRNGNRNAINWGFRAFQLQTRALLFSPCINLPLRPLEKAGLLNRQSAIDPICPCTPDNLPLTIHFYEQKDTVCTYFCFL